MNYSALIENRRSVREFTDKKIPVARLGDIRKYYRNHAKRLLPELRTDLVILDSKAREALEGALRVRIEKLDEESRRILIEGGDMLADLSL